MKQGISFVLPVEFGTNLNMDNVEQIFFLFSQRSKIKDKAQDLLFNYPSETAVRRGETNIIDLLWTENDTWLFDANIPVLMDTKIYIYNSITQPETPIIKLHISPTLFERSDPVLEDDT